MKFWMHPDAVKFQGGLFPTYHTNTGELLSSNKRKWSEEFKAAEKDKVTKGLVEPDYNFIRAHSCQYTYGIAFHMTGKPEYLELCRKGA